MKKLPSLSRQQCLKLCVLLLWALACWAFFQFRYAYHFYYEEQNMLFLMDAEYLCSYFGKPAWLACLCGDFLTQFYHYLYLGAIILTLSIMTLGDLVRRCLDRITCRLPKVNLSWVSFILAIAAMTLVARLSLYERFKLDSVIALMGGAGLWLLLDYFPIKRWWARMPAFLVVMLLGYWLFGNGIIVTGVLEMLTINIVPAVVVNVCVYFVISWTASNFYLTAENALHYPLRWHLIDYNAAMANEADLMLDNEYYFGNYGKVIDLYEHTGGEKTEAQTFYYCLALAQMDLLPDKLMDMENPNLGTFYTIGEDTPMYVIKMINDLYYLIGDMTYAERAALLGNTFSPRGRNARMIKRLAEANLISSDEAAAMKYLRLLQKTICYRNWAEEHMPGQQTQFVKFEIEKKQKFVNKEDKIRLGDNCYTILTQLLDSNKDNIVALDFLLCSDIIARQKDTFNYDFEKYGPRNKALYIQARNMQ